MDSDRELLELAAKAHGGRWRWVSCPKFAGKVPGFASLDTVNGTTGWPGWNPLEDDGDALRLAVRLGLAVDCFVPTWHQKTPTTMVLYGPRLEGRLTDRCHEKHSDDPCAATRRAIVRAAAAIGKSM